MAFNYFSKLPIIQYPLNSTESKEARDILHRLFLDQRFADSSEYLRKYTVNDGDRPETISKKLYDRSDLHLVISTLNTNDIFNGLPPHSFIYEEFVEEKYGDSVYYLYPTDSSASLNSGTETGRSGGYVYPAFGYGFEVGEKIFAIGPSGFAEESPRAWVKSWDPVYLSVVLDVLDGEFTAGMTVGKVDGSNTFIIGHKKRGRDAVHHFEALQTTTTGTPLVKGSRIDPLSEIVVSGSGVYLTPIGLSSALGNTGDFNGTLAYLYNLTGAVPSSYSSFIGVVTNQEWELKQQEQKRRITVPVSEAANLQEFLNKFSTLIESTGV
jgi:hypothetical protein